MKTFSLLVVSMLLLVGCHGELKGDWFTKGSILNPNDDGQYKNTMVIGTPVHNQMERVAIPPGDPDYVK